MVEKPQKITADDILEALIARSDDLIWATEVDFDCTRRNRIDFWTLHPHGKHLAVAYEIKITKGDFRRDTDEKQETARRYSDRFFYVAPKGLLVPNDVPAWAGLMTWDGNRFSIPKKPPLRRKAEPDWSLIVSVLRNSGEARRDTEFLRSQLAFFKSKDERDRRIERHRWRLDARKWERRAASDVAAEARLSASELV